MDKNISVGIVDIVVDVDITGRGDTTRAGVDVRGRRAEKQFRRNRRHSI